MRSVFVLFLLLISVGVVVQVDGDVFDGFQKDYPVAPYIRHYDLFYKNLPSVQPCVLVSNVASLVGGNSPAQRASLSHGQVSGCVPPPDQEQYMLFPFTLNNFDRFLSHVDGCRREGSSSSSSSMSIDADRIQWLQSVVPHNQGPLTLVLTVPSSSSSTAAPTAASNGSTDSSSIQAGATFNLTCVLQYLAADLATAVPSSPIRGLFYQAHPSATNTSFMGAQSPLQDFSSYGASAHHWIPSGTSSLWQGANLTVMGLPREGGEWDAVQEKALYNWQQVVNPSDGSLVAAKDAKEVYPREVAQTLFPMYMAEHQTVETFTPFVPSCLTQTSPYPSCLPIGGQSAWGTTASLPSLDLISTKSASSRGTTNVSNTAGNIAVMVSLSSTAFLHDQVPGADAAASGATALTLVVDTVSKKLNYFRRNNTAPQISFFYFWGEDYGLSGSGRFIKDLNGFNCEYVPESENTFGACLWPPRYTSNFTGLDLDSFEHIIHVDQVGLTSDLYYHADAELTASSPAQKQVNTLLFNTGVKASTVSQLVPGPLMSFYRNQTKAKQLTQSYTTISGYNAQYLNANYQTPEDLPQYVQVAHIVNAAEKVVFLLEGLLNSSSSSQQQQGEDPASVAFPVVDAALATTLWNCFGEDIGCLYFKDKFGFTTPVGTAPNYYPSIYMRYQHIAQVTQFARYFMILSLLDDENPLRAVNQTENPDSEDMSCPCAKPELQWCHNSKCYWRHGFLHDSYSPFLLDVPYEYSYIPVYVAEDAEYRAYEAKNPNGAISHPQIWVESFWDPSTGARLATIDNDLHGGLALLSGILTTLLTGLALYTVDRWLGPWLKK